MSAATPITAWDIGEQSAKKKLRKFGHATMQRIRIERVKTLPVAPLIQDVSVDGGEPR